MLQLVSCLSKDAARFSQLYKFRCPLNPCRRVYSQLPDKRLRILFCGSDEFSISSLKALHNYSQEVDSDIASIDVAAKTDKRVGRGLKIIRPPAIKPVARSLDLPVHQFDTFRGWNLPRTSDGESYINMVIAVSFGLLVPPRILGACQYGGLNVHPSLLPDLKGSAPIEHAIINGYQRTGVSVQTLHPSKFDEGRIVMQTPSPGLDIPRPDEITSSELREQLAPIGAEMLVKCLREKRYLDAALPPPKVSNDKVLNHAPKLSSTSRHIEFQTMSLTHILRLNRALGRLWVNVPGNGEQADARLVYGHNIREAETSQIEAIPKDFLEHVSPGIPFNTLGAMERPEGSKLPLLVKTCDSKVLSIPEMTVSGMKPGPALASAAKAGIIRESQTLNQRKLYVFEQVLG